MTFCRLVGDVSASTGDMIGAVVFLVLAALAVAGMVYGTVRRDLPMLTLIVGCVAVFQVAHFSEHTQQVAALMANPGEIAMTPWASSLARGLGVIVGRDGAGGNEVLHLAGDSIYLSGLICLFVAHRLTAQRRPLASWALGFQTAHTVEHVSLVTTMFLVGRPLGVSTLFGVTYRVLWHFTINAAGSACWVGDSIPAVRTMRARRRQRWVMI